MPPKLPVITPKQMIQVLERAGFVVHRQRGSHLFLKSTSSPLRIVCVPVHSVDLKKGTLKAILRQARMSVPELIRLL